MKKLVGLLMSWLAIVAANGQFMFPDQLAVIQEAYDQRLVTASPSRRPFPTYPSFSSIPGNIVAAPSSQSAGFEVQDTGVRTDGSFSIASAPSGPSVGFSADNSQFQNQGSLSIASLPPAPSVPLFPKVTTDPEAEYWNNHVNNLIARGVGKFALDMDREIARSLGSGRSNVIFSPLSLVSTLALVLLGSAGMTFEQVAKILGLESGVDLSSHSEIVHQMFGLLLDTIEASPNNSGPQATMASGMFVQNGYPIRPEFKAIAKDIYNNEIINVDFIRQPNQATRAVNDWVNLNTRGKIANILDHQVDPDTKLIIASALYFNGEWNQHFLINSTKRKQFNITPTEGVMVDMMAGSGEFPFYEDKSLRAKIIGLPYKGYAPGTEQTGVPIFQAMMYVVLPTTKSADALRNLERSLTVDILQGMISKMRTESCVIGLPRMKLSSTLNLNRALQSLGLQSLFNPSTSNLGILSQGNTGIPIHTRFGGDDDDNSKEDRKTSTGERIVPSKKTNFFRYEDKVGGYTVEQWNSGVSIKKIRRPIGGRPVRRINYGPNDERRQERESYEIQRNSTEKHKLRYVDIDGDKYKFEEARPKRQGRPIDRDFIRFLESRNIVPKFGLDALRNRPDLGNPGLYASDVLHKVELEVTETGTVGAAATSVLIQKSSVKTFNARKPFLFFIRHETSRLPLFWGTVYKPTPNY